MGAAGFAVMAGMQVASGVMGAQSAKDQGRFEQTQNDFNAEMSEVAATDAVRRGDKAANRVRSDAKRVKGAQRASYAAQGVLVDSGSAAEVVADTDVLAEEDVATVKNNAWREAFGYKVQAQNYRTAGQMAKMAARNTARASILGGGLGAGQSMMYSFAKK